MVYCHECRSEIAEIDTFCPYCGITLQPINIAVEKESDNETELQEDSLTTDDMDKVQADVDSGQLYEDSAEDIDMADTIVVQPETLIESKKTQAEGGYIDISSLKEDESSATTDEANAQDMNIDQSVSDQTVEAKTELSTDQINEGIETADETVFENESAMDPDISENQADIKDLLTGESADVSDEVTPTNEEIIESDKFNEQKTLLANSSEIVDKQAQADEKAIETVTNTIDEIDSDDEAGSLADKVSDDEDPDDEESHKDFVDSASHDKGDQIEASEQLSVESETGINSEVNLPAENKNLTTDDVTGQQTDAENQTFEESTVTVEEENESDTAPNQILSANDTEIDDTEIDDAVSVIDSKVSVWNKEEDILTTNSIRDENSLEPANESEITETDNSEISDEISDSANVLPAQETDALMFEESDNSGENSDESNIGDNSDELPPADSEANVQIQNKDDEESTINNDETAAPEATPELTGQEIDASDLKTDDSEQFESSADVADQAEPAEAQNEKVPNSETTPNMGFGDTDGSNAQKLKPLDEGIVLNGRYEIVRKIGGGGMGAVYLANDKNLGGVLRAVKEMVQSYIEKAQQEKALQDFKRESMLLTSLDHPSIPTIYDYFYEEKEGRFYLVMKYISGGDLAARLRSAPEGKLDEQSVTDWAFQIAHVLDYLHSKNPPIVYRDLKPANVMIDGNTDKVMLIDFGIARWINKEEKGVTAVGTMGYAPPELFSGNVQPASDIYSLGSTMFHLLTGADPQNNPLLIFDFQKHPRPRQINPQLSDQMERILMRAVEYNAEKRFNSAAEMRNALEEHLNNLKAGNVSFGIKETPTAISLSDQPVFCGFCGQKIVATDMFCAFCGAKQPLAQPGVHSQEYHIPQFTARLVIEGTTDLQYPAFELVKNENLVGRRDPMSNIFPEVDLSKFDPQTKISRKHARIWRDGEKFLIEDLGSSNGTIWISAQTEKIRLIPHQTQVLQSGDKIQLGDTTLEFIAG